MMQVARLYELNLKWFALMRLWSLETVFSSTPTLEGRRLTLERLEEHRDGVGEVIKELKQELEDDEWLL